MDDLQDSQESIVITFWERKEDMDLFYKPNSNVLGDLVEKLKPSFEHSPERKDWGGNRSRRPKEVKVRD
jgi:hypothetical protein